MTEAASPAKMSTPAALLGWTLILAVVGAVFVGTLMLKPKGS